MGLGPINPLTNLPTVEETRNPARWRSMPRYYSKKADELKDPETIWKIDYLLSDGVNVTGVQCWKCGRDLMGWKPALRTVSHDKKRNISQGKIITVAGQPAVTLGVFNCYREGTFQFRRNGVPGHFTFLHCSDCHIKDEDGERLMAIFLAGKDDRREAIREAIPFVQDEDNDWALYMYLYSEKITHLERIIRTDSLQDLQKMSRKR